MILGLGLLICFGWNQGSVTIADASEGLKTGQGQNTVRLA
jgi:hypothetical protein